MNLVQNPFFKYPVESIPVNVILASNRTAESLTRSMMIIDTVLDRIKKAMQDTRIPAEVKIKPFRTWAEMEHGFNSTKLTIMNHAHKVLSHVDYEQHFKKRNYGKGKNEFHIPEDIFTKIYDSIHT